MPANKAEGFLMFLVLAIVVTACVAMHGTKHARKTVDQEYSEIERTITVTPTTITIVGDSK